MSVKLRFRRMGRRKAPVYGLVATDSRSPRDGRFIEDLGRYEPVAEPSTFKVDTERVLYWLGQGAQPSDTVRNLLQKEGVLLQWALTRQGKEADEIETALAEFRERQQVKAGTATKKTNAERRAEALQAERASAKEKAAQLAKERAEREAELQKQREEAEAAARAEAEEARAAAASDAADSEALTTAADAPAAGGDSETPAAAVTGEPVAQTSSQADGDDDTADEKADAEAEGGDAAVAEATPESVAAEAPDAAEEQPAATATTSQEVADATAAAMAAQTEAGAKEDDAVTEAPATEAPDTTGTSGDQPAGDTPPAAGTPDDLTAISGVGPKYSGILTDAGITTFAQLAETPTERVQEMISEAGSSSPGSEETWPEQARMLAAGDTDGHAAYVESLKS